jgi:hypothetical protein
MIFANVLKTIIIDSLVGILILNSFYVANTNAEYPVEITCMNYTNRGTASPVAICYSTELLPLSTLEDYGNGTLIVYQTYSLTNTIYTSATKGNKTRNLNREDTILMTFEMRRDGSFIYNGSDTTTTKFAKIDGVAHCKSHEYCGDNKYSVDCTNIRFGRKIVCEPWEPFFFPFTPQIVASGLPLQKLPLSPPNAQVKCQDFSIPNSRSPSFPICAKTNVTTGSSNTTKIGKYTIYGSDRRKAVFSISFNTARKVLKVNSVGDCQNFKSCGDGKFSVDCTTMKFGRNVICEPAEPIFFPFTAEATRLPSKAALVLPTD